MRLPVSCLALTFAALLATVARAEAQVTWISDSSGSWDTASNWSTNQVPQAGEDVIIDRPGFVTVTIDTPTEAIASLDANETLIVNSTLTVTGNTFFDGGLFLRGALAGGGTFELRSNGEWETGTISRPFVIRTGATFFITTGSNHVLSATTLVNEGTVQWLQAGPLTVSGTASVTNATGAIWDVQAGSVTIGTGSAGTQSFTNDGTLRKSFILGTLTIGGSVAFSNTGTIELRLGGAGGGQFDVLALTQPFVFGGTLDVATTGGFTPRFFQAFDVVTYPSRTNTFSAIDGNGETYIDEYRTTALRLRPLADPLENLIRNGTLDTDLTNWLTHATPDISYLSATVTSGVLNFFRVPPPAGTSNQATVYQETQAFLPEDTPMTASFDLANTSSVRKRISVLILDSDFSDLAVCTFWLEPNAPMRTYGMDTQTNRDWQNAAMYFYAASAGSNGGAYQVDNVSLVYNPVPPANRTMCHDATVPTAPGGAMGPDMMSNGDFGTGTLAPWGLFGQIQSQISSGVFEFIKLAGTPAGVVLQGTGETMTAGEILTSTFELGNSSGVRKRVTVILHDNDFSDLSACTFWLDPGQALATYTYRTFTTKAWTNATVSVYPATVGADQWIRLDNVTFQRTPGTTIVGTECVEPVGGGGDQRLASTPSSTAGDAAASMPGPLMPDAPAMAPATPAEQTVALPPALAEWLSYWVVDGFLPIGDWLRGPSWTATATDTRLRTVRPLERLDLTQAVSAHVRFNSTLRTTSGSEALVQVSHDGVTWETVHVVAPSASAAGVDIDLTAHRGTAVFLRFALEGVAPDDGAAVDMWRLDDISLDVVVDVQVLLR